MRSLTGSLSSASGRRSPLIRSPSLLQTTSLVSSSRSTSSSSSLTKNPLSIKATRLLQALIVLVVVWYEYGIFYISTRPSSWNRNCFVQPTPHHPELPSSSASRSFPLNREDATQILVVTDPQLFDLERSYAGERSTGLKWLTIEITNRFMKKSWKLLTRGGGTSHHSEIDAVVWNGDLLDNGRDMVETQEYSEYTRLFHRLFPLPRQRSKNQVPSNHEHHLDPPVPVIFVPGNHDLPLHPTSAVVTSTDSTDVVSISNEETSPLTGFKTARTKFRESFGPLWGEREIGGWNLIWIDSIALIEQGFWSDHEEDIHEGSTDVKEFHDMKNWLEGLGDGPVEIPRILFTHIPLFRPPSTSCGKQRESNRFNGGIRDGYGRGYQNLIGQMETDWLMKRVRPEKVFSGDDHDYCFVTHDYASPFDETKKVTETTVKSFSMAMGVDLPGYSFLTLYPPSTVISSSSTPSSPPTFEMTPSVFVERSCTLPSQIAIYLYVYLLLSISLYGFFLFPKLVTVSKSFLKRRRRKRLRQSKSKVGQGGRRGTNRLRRNLLGSLRSGGGGGGGEKVSQDDHHTHHGGEPDLEEVTTKLDLNHDDGGGFGYGYSANLAQGDHEDSEPISNRPSRYDRFEGDDAEENSSSSSSDGGDDTRDTGWNMMDPIGRRSRRPSKVRRVSKVWMWEKNDSSSSSLLSTPSLPTTRVVLPRYSSSPFDDDFSSPHTTIPLTSRVKDLVIRGLNRLAQNSLRLPIIRLLRPFVRTLRTVAFVLLGKPLGWIAGMLGGDRGIGRAMREAANEFWNVSWMGILVWAMISVWIGT